MEILKKITLVISFFCLIPAPHFLPLPVGLVQFVEPGMSTIPLVIGQLLMLLGVIGDKRNIIWIVGFVLSGVGYLLALIDHYPQYVSVLISPVDLAVVFGPFCVTGLIAIFLMIKRKTLLDN